MPKSAREILALGFCGGCAGTSCEDYTKHKCIFITQALSQLRALVKGARPRDKQIRYEQIDKTMDLKTGKIIAEHQQITYDKEAEAHNVAVAEYDRKLDEVLGKEEG